MKTEYLTFAFHFMCIVSTAGLLFYCSYKYIQNESTSLVDYRVYHQSEKDIYPSLSLCFQGMGIYDAHKLNKIYGLKETREYVEFLQGRVWKDDLLDVTYDDVTIDLKDYVENISLTVNSYFTDPVYIWKNDNVNGSLEVKPNHKNASSFESGYTYPFYITFRQAITKCYTLDFSGDILTAIDGKIVRTMAIVLRNMRLQGLSLFYTMHYPEQLIRSSPMDIELPGYPGIISGTLTKKNFWIENLEVTRRRNTYKTPCNREIIGDDNLILEKKIEEAGCRPPHWSVKTNYPICNSKESMSQTNIQPSDFGNPDFLKPFIEPCDQLQNVIQMQTVIQSGPTKQNRSHDDLTTHINLMFKSSNYKEILHIRDFDIESLVGNMGGYVGLFLGFAVWQVPNAIKDASDKLKSLVIS